MSMKKKFVCILVSLMMLAMSAVSIAGAMDDTNALLNITSSNGTEPQRSKH